MKIFIIRASGAQMIMRVEWDSWGGIFLGAADWVQALENFLGLVRVVA
jgi:hypothetical protein